MSVCDLACTRGHSAAYGVQYKDGKLSGREENPRADFDKADRMKRGNAVL